MFSTSLANARRGAGRLIGEDTCAWSDSGAGVDPVDVVNHEEPTAVGASVEDVVIADAASAANRGAGAFEYVQPGDRALAALCSTGGNSAAVWRPLWTDDGTHSVVLHIALG